MRRSPRPVGCQKSVRAVGNLRFAGETPILAPDSRLLIEDCQVELAESLGVGEDVDLDDFPAPDREAAD
jgi:hypothetical protein